MQKIILGPLKWLAGGEFGKKWQAAVYLALVGYLMPIALALSLILNAILLWGMRASP